MTTMSAIWRGLGWPGRAVIALVLAAIVLLGVQSVNADPTYHVRLRHAAGIEPGDDVRVAGLTVGKVVAIDTDRDQVDVEIALDQDPAELGITDDSTAEVKLLSMLGQRFLSLEPGSGAPLSAGDTISVTHAVDSYTIERFWLESTPQVQALDLRKVQEAVDVLATDLDLAPQGLRDALDGIAGVSAVATARADQLDGLLTSIRRVTDLVLAQTGQLDSVMADGTRVLLMVHERREVLRALLTDAHRFVTGLTTLVRETAPHLRPGLRDLRTTLTALHEHRDQLDRALQLAGPTMRVFTNATGDGPWLGVNAPWAIVPDDLVCSITPEECR